MSSLIPPKGAVNVPWNVETGRPMGQWMESLAPPRPAGRKDISEVFHPNECTGEEKGEARWPRGVHPWAQAGHIGTPAWWKGTE